MDTLLGMSITLLCFSVAADVICSIDSDDEYKRAVGWTTVVLFTISMLFFLTHQYKEIHYHKCTITEEV